MNQIASNTIDTKVAAARGAFRTGRTKSLDWRRKQLEELVRMLDVTRTDIETALERDLGRSPVDTFLSEWMSVVDEAKHALKNLRKWSKDRSVRSEPALWPSSARIRREPYGTVLIIGAWNYPLHLSLMPMIGALAAGNSIILKPSELAPATSRLLADQLPRYLDADAVKVVEGGVDETTDLLTYAFDKIFYTGNGTVGSVVMQAAAKHLTPVTLELGGKSPVWVDSSFPVERAARAIAWGKFSNCGQTCVAPDYVLTTPEVAPLLADAIGRVIREFYGDDPKASRDYARIVNERHAERLASLLDSGRIVAGGAVHVEGRYVAPTVLLDVALDSPVMKDEIFGPILPIVAVKDHRAAIEVINARPKPLAMYAFTERSEVRDDLLDQTSSGSVAFGSVMIQLGVKQLPFGGVGASGMGAYHGEHSFLAFSHQRSVLTKGGAMDLTKVAQPPFDGWKKKYLYPSK